MKSRSPGGLVGYAALPQSTKHQKILRLEIVHFQRRPYKNQHSIEGLFANYRDEMRRLGAEVECKEMPWYSAGVLYRVRNILWARRNQSSVNHITGDVHYVALGLNRRSTVLTIHDTEILERNRWMKRWVLKLLWFDLPIRCVSTITVISEATKQALIRHCPASANKIEVVPNAISPLFTPSARSFNSVRPTILQFGSKPNKNVARVAQALRGISCHLIVVGNVIAKEALERNEISYEQRENLTDEELVATYRECDIVSFVSTYEGFGMPIVEAQATERPVVTSDCSSMPEVAGSGACFVDPFDVASIRDGFVRVINDNDFRSQIVAQGRANRVRFQMDNVVVQYMEIYRRLHEQES